MSEIVPVQKGNKEETFRALCKDFNIDNVVLDVFKKSSIENLEEFRFYFTKEDEIDNFVARAISLKDEALRIQVARVRRAWAAVRQGAKKREEGRTVQHSVDLDDLLEEATLHDVKAQFWMRYRLRYPAEVMAADSLLSRCYRELERRLLTVFSVTGAKSLMHQVTNTKKRKLIAEGLYWYEDETMDVPSRSAEAYLGGLFTYLLALAIAGSGKVSGAPSSEDFGSDSTKYVTVPWDVLQSYYFRACRMARQLPEASRLRCLERCDVAERAVWVAQFCAGTDTLGHVIQTVYTERDAHWEVSPALRSAPAPQQPQSGSPRGTPWPNETAKGGKGGKGGKRGRVGELDQSAGGKGQGDLVPGTISKTLRDGTKLCPDFQSGKCKVRKFKCPKGVHKCGYVLKNGRVCGMPYHGAHKCNR